MLRSSIIILFALVLMGCGNNNCFKPTATASFGSDTDASDITFDPSVPGDLQTLLKADLSMMGALKLEDKAEDKCVMGITDFSGTSLVRYFKTRVRYVIGESYDYKKPALTSRSDSGTTIYASLAGHTAAEGDDKGILTVMSNASGWLYYATKETKSLATLTIAGESVPIYSPRDGVVQTGKGIRIRNNVPSSAEDALVNRLLRLTVMLHEARHSDGHGETLVFSHIDCTEGTYASVKGACGKYANGPYAVQALMIRKLMSACTGCTDTEMAGMMRLQADYEGRVKSGSPSGDDRPEGFVTTRSTAR